MKPPTKEPLLNKFSDGAGLLFIEKRTNELPNREESVAEVVDHEVYVVVASHGEA